MIQRYLKRWILHLSLAFITSLSLVLGLAREIICAQAFGATRAMDLFLYSFIPYDLLLPASRDLPSGIQGHLAGKSDADLFYLIKKILFVAFIFGLLCCLIYFLSFGWATRPDLEGVLTLRSWWLILGILSLAILLMMLHVGLCSYFVNSGNLRFQVYQPIFLNFGIIVSVFALATSVGIISISAGVLVGSALLVAYEVMVGRSAIWRILSATKPATYRIKMGGLLVAMLFISAQAIGSRGTILVERSIGLDLPDGSISLLNYATRLWGIPLNIFALAALLPMITSVTRAYANSEYGGIRKTLTQTIVVLSIVFIPIVAGLALFGQDLIRILFERGQFSAIDTASVDEVLKILLLGSFGAIASAAAMRVLWIFNRAWEVALLSWICLAIYFIAALPLVDSFGLIGLAVGNVIYYNSQAIFFLLLVNRELNRACVPI